MTSLRLGGRERGLPDRQRDLADRGPGRGNLFFFTIAQFSGASAPVLRRTDRDGTSRTGMGTGYVIGGLIMVLGGVVELAYGIKAEGQSLETVTRPLTEVSD